MSKYGEPLGLHEVNGVITNHKGEVIAAFAIDHLAWANRIASCVNALEGISDPAEFRKVFGEMKEALNGLKRGDCWCESGIGNPMMKGGHTYNCNFAKQVLVKAKELKGDEKL